ncbi:DNA recombination protein RmuC [Parasphingopyxis sp.]|uniref:DNA recombination protein RmuC n=1 Tax=Parasphingopyxis sp. TaxID=1920299 RepID=UPI002628A5A3|nr:DNA recombination protein RmuC [Parasphingopyxis sp.]
MEPTSVIAFVLIALVVGAVLGWLANARAAVPLREENEHLRSVAERTDQEGQRKVEELTLDLSEARQELAALNAARQERDANFEQQKKSLLETKELLSAQFSKIGSELLDHAQKKFLSGANEHLVRVGDDNKKKIESLLKPVETTLKRYEENLSRIEKEREGSYRELSKAVSDLTQGNEIVRRETQRLANVMGSSPKARGRWGEEQLRTILMSAGLAENIDFELQTTVKDGEKQLRPDCIINLPGDRCIIVDVKCPLVAFEQAYDEEDESRRAKLLQQHADAMKAYANDLGRKGYWRQFKLSPEFVIMFVPGEHFLSAAAERAPELIRNAFENGVIIASTINMLALAKVMAGMWRQEALAERAEEIGEVGKELYRRLRTMGGHVTKLGRNINLASSAYNDMVGSLESQVLTQAKRFEDLQVDTGGKSIEPPSHVETQIRPLTKLKDDLGEDTPDAAE